MATDSGLWTVTFGQFVETIKALEAKGVKPEHFARLRSDKKWAKQVASFMQGNASTADSAPASAPAALPVTEFNLRVNYALDMETAVKDGKYDYANPNITAENFPTTRKGAADLTIHLVHFDREIDSDPAIAELDKMGLRPAETHELLALGAKHPDLQREFTIIALGSVWRGPVGCRGVPCLDGHVADRNLRLYWYGDGWVRVRRFAAVSK